MSDGSNFGDTKAKFKADVQAKQARLQDLLNRTSDPGTRQDIQLEISVLDELCHLVNLAYTTRYCGT